MSTKEVSFESLDTSSRVLTVLGIIESLQHLHDELRDYHAPPVVHPSVDLLKPTKKSVFSSLFGSSKATVNAIGEIPKNLPRGLYLFGDVGSGKTMLMDLFHDTLPPSVKSKTRIHFHNFMQDVHKRLHKMKMEHGNDVDAVPFVAADIAEQGNVLCFDEFQCTDVADAMILRRYADFRNPLHTEAHKGQIIRSSHVARHSHGHHLKSYTRRALQEWNPARIIHSRHRVAEKPLTCHQPRLPN